MKTFTVTFHHTCNYGALFQTYALQQTILGLGHENVVFEYFDQLPLYSRPRLSSPGAFARTVYINFQTFLRRKQTGALRESFARFHDERLILSQIYQSMQDLRENAPDVDCLITGSDQVWRMSGNREFLPARFLDFGDEHCKRISYAASIEALNYSETEKAQAKGWLERFSGISLREETARVYIEELTGRAASRVLDPVFLLGPDDWRKIMVPPRIKEPYILCYQVQRNARMQETIDRLKAETGLAAVSICNSSIRWIETEHTYFDVSPEEFLGFYQNAAIVVSASFHGTAFGIIFNKPTYGLARQGYSNRIYEILELFELSEFCISGQSTLPPPTIRTDTVQGILRKEREESLEYLKEQLS